MNIRRLLAVYEAVNSQNRAALLGQLHPEFEFEDTGAFPAPRVYRGGDAAWQYFGELWAGVKVELDTLKDAGEELLVILRERQDGPGTRPTLRFGHVWTPRDGGFGRLQLYPDPAEAWEALGLRT